MTITTSVYENTYTGNDSTTVFQYGFKIADEADLNVYLIDLTTSVRTAQVLNTDYTVSNVGETGGGNVTFTTAPEQDIRVFIQLDAPLLQESVFGATGRTGQQQLEDSADNDVNVGKTVKSLLSRSLSAQVGDDTVPSELEYGTNKNDKLLYIDESGSLKSITNTEVAAWLDITPDISAISSNITEDYDVGSIDNGKFLLADTTSSASGITVTLGTSQSQTNNFSILVKKTDTSTKPVTIATEGSEKIDGGDTVVLRNYNDCAWLVSDGSGWKIAAVDKKQSMLGVNSNANVTLEDRDTLYLADVSAASLTILLPPVATVGSGFSVSLIVIVPDGGLLENAKFQAHGSEKINGGSTAAVTNPYQHIKIVCTGTEWVIV
jgi:hypothetical protein